MTENEAGFADIHTAWLASSPDNRARMLPARWHGNQQSVAVAITYSAGANKDGIDMTVMICLPAGAEPPCAVGERCQLVVVGVATVLCTLSYHPSGESYQAFELGGEDYGKDYFADESPAGHPLAGSREYCLEGVAS